MQARLATSAPSVVGAAMLWTATVVIGLLDIYYLRELFYIVILVTNQVDLASLGNVVAAAAAFALMIYLVASTEFHFRNWGKPQSWQLFGITLLVETAIVVLAFLI